MARWLQSAGLQHLGASSAAGGVGAGDLRGGGGLLPSLMQGYGPQSIEEKQKLYTLLRSLNFNGELASASISEPYTPTGQSFSGGAPADGFYSPELRGELGAGLLDLHAMDDSELLSEVRKRPLNKKEVSRKEEDIIDVHNSQFLTVHEPKLKVDLTAYVEKRDFCLDTVLDENVTNDESSGETSNSTAAGWLTWESRQPQP